MDEEARSARADAPELLEHDDIEQVVETQSAVFLRHRATEEPLLARLEPELARHDPIVLPLRMIGHNFVLDEATDSRAPNLVLFVKQGAFDHDLVSLRVVQATVARCALSRWVERWIASRATRHCSSVSAVRSAKVDGSGEMLAAVDRDRLAGQIVAAVGEKEDDQILQFLNLSVAPERHGVRRSSRTTWRRGSD